MASDRVASARSLSAAVTRSSGQMPPMSAMAVANATIRLARRIAAAIRSRRTAGAIAASSAIAVATTRIRSRGDQCAQAGCLAHREVGEVGAVAAQRAQQRRDRRSRRQPCLGATDLGEALGQPVRRARVEWARPSRWQAKLRVGHPWEGWP